MATKRKRATASADASSRRGRTRKPSTRLSREEANPYGDPPEDPGERNAYNMRICVGASLHCAGASDRIAAEDEYIRSHGGDLELMRRVREQGRVAQPLQVVFVPDARVAALQADCMRSAANEFVALLEETRALVRRMCDETIGALHETPADIEPLHTAGKVGMDRMLLQLTARAYRNAANARLERSDVGVSRILREVLSALERGDGDRIDEIAKFAEPSPRDMHATPRSATRVQELGVMHAKLCRGLAALYGVDTAKDIATRAASAGFDAEMAARIESVHGKQSETIRKAPAQWLANAFVESVESMPGVFADRGVPFSTAPRFNAQGDELINADPERIALVEAAYRKLLRLGRWVKQAKDDGEIKERAFRLMEAGFWALGMPRNQARAVVNTLVKRVERAERNKELEA